MFFVNVCKKKLFLVSINDMNAQCVTVLVPVFPTIGSFPTIPAESQNHAKIIMFAKIECV